MNETNILNLFYQFSKNLFRVFSKKYLPWHLLAIVLTYLLVISGFDWQYYKFFRDTFLYPFSFSAAIVGALFPLLVPLFIFLLGTVKKNLKTLNMGFALGQAALIGSIVSSLYKAITGRAYPPQLLIPNGIDLTKVFKFSFFQSGIFWGWPSSHTAIAFAMAVTLIYLFPGNKKVKYLSWAYAFYMGLSVAISIHWFSDFVAGAIIGTVIGIIVGKSFQLRFSNLKANVKS